jgi:DNA-binding protein YbaB
MARRNDESVESDPNAQDAREALQQLNDENALLRAALADARAQLGEAEEQSMRAMAGSPAMPRCAMSRGC